MNKRKTLTPDRGQEFAHYERISTENHVDCYFAAPSSPWQRGTNENTNGLVREYLPKSVDMTPISDDFIETVTFKINNRPRKCLGWKTPCCAKQFTAIKIISEIGSYMSQFPTAGHLCSWAGLTPTNNESANKKKSVRISKSGPYLKPLLV